MQSDYVATLPSTYVLQDESQPQSDQQAESISERFFDEVRQLLEQKISSEAAAAAAADLDVTTTTESSVINEENAETTISVSDGAAASAVAAAGAANRMAKDNLPAIRPPKPVQVSDWPKLDLRLGQVVAVSIGVDGHPVIFHRADRIWTDETFNETNHYQLTHIGPIDVDTILKLDAANGKVLNSWGASLFFFPHGMTIDHHGNIWVTDVALHQVFKFKPKSRYPSITIGRRFQPGSVPSQLCKPTAVAVATTGEIFVADGYCNNRILKFNAAGRILRVIPQPPEFLSLQVPHGLTLLEHLDLICIADRENMRVVCPRAGLKSSLDEGTPAATIQEPDLGRVFDVAAYGNYVYAINGPTSQIIPVRGFTIDPMTEQIIDHWGGFENPHTIAICPNGSAMYVGEIGPNRLTKFTFQNNSSLN